MTAAAKRQEWMSRARAMLGGGAASVTTGVVITNLLRIVSSLTLTRLLTAADYGVVGILVSVTYAIAMLADAGLMPFIVRHEKADDPKFLDEVWTIHVVRGIALAIATVAVAGPMSAFLHKGELTKVIMVWGLSFVIEGTTSLAFATAIREQKLWRMSIMETGGNIVSLIVSIILALVLHSYWAIVFGMLTASVVKTLLSYALFAGSGRRLRFSRLRSLELWRFSRTIAMSSVLTLLIVQVDKIFLVRMLPLETYGLYAIATTLAIAPEAIAAPYAQRVLYPVYVTAARGTTEHFREVFYRARRHVSWLYAFAVGGLIGGAPLLVAILYDSRYTGVALFLQILAIRVMLRMPNLAAYEATIAYGRMRSGLIANIARIVWLAAGVVIAEMYGNAYILVFAVATDEIPAALWFWGELSRLGALRRREELTYLAMAAAGVTVGVGFLTAANLLFHLSLRPW